MALGAVLDDDVDVKFFGDEDSGDDVVGPWSGVGPEKISFLSTLAGFRS